MCKIQNKFILYTIFNNTYLVSYCRLVSKFCPVAHQAPLSMGFPRQEYWSALPFPSPEDLPDPGIKPKSSALAGRFFITEPPGKPYIMHTYIYIT